MSNMTVEERDAEMLRMNLVMSLYSMTKEELESFKVLAYGKVSNAVDDLIDKAISLKA